ncbi:hypothetical protein Acr_16g0005790 [Actinidia rufa]|uniref:Tf2-1-like SH3-like domain-containing protein n=1 Tax=Actinidia rufa TaxID=165716 RepID=A0A7J0FZ26_9ERIC|nr:hypothetical protein Acr_16g0005790 [Actinidia rufa]
MPLLNLFFAIVTQGPFFAADSLFHSLVVAAIRSSDSFLILGVTLHVIWLMVQESEEESDSDEEFAPNLERRGRRVNDRQPREFDRRWDQGLRYPIQDQVILHDLAQIDEVYRLALKVESQLKRSSTRRVDMVQSGSSSTGELKQVQREVLEKLRASNIKYKEAADEHRKEQSFSVGDLVMVHFRCARFSTGSYGKLSRRKFGPFRTLKKLGTNAYLLDLPDDVSTSPVFNVADLFLFHGEPEPPDSIEVATLPFADVSTPTEEYIEDVVDVRTSKTRTGPSMPLLNLFFAIVTQGLFFAADSLFHSVVVAAIRSSDSFLVRPNPSPCLS